MCNKRFVHDVLLQLALLVRCLGEWGHISPSLPGSGEPQCHLGHNIVATAGIQSSLRAHNLQVSNHTSPTAVESNKTHPFCSIYHKSTADDSFQVTNTTLTFLNIENLKPNMQYIVYVTAVSSKGESAPSETLIAWTDPAYPAFVEVNIINGPPFFHMMMHLSTFFGQ